MYAAICHIVASPLSIRERENHPQSLSSSISCTRSGKKTSTKHTSLPIQITNLQATPPPPAFSTPDQNRRRTRTHRSGGQHLQSSFTHRQCSVAQVHHQHPHQRAASISRVSHRAVPSPPPSTTITAPPTPHHNPIGRTHGVASACARAHKRASTSSPSGRAANTSPSSPPAAAVAVVP